MSKPFVKKYLLSQGVKISPCKPFLKWYPVKGSVRTKLFAERYMQVEHERAFGGLGGKRGDWLEPKYFSVSSPCNKGKE
ncbi:MAG: hypothetical protein QW231_06985, partial [Candidatus Bathyarchaeia archaeon]